MPVNITVSHRLDGETEKLLRDIVSDKYHRLAVSEADFETLEERPYFTRALDEKMIFISAPGQAAHVSIGIRRNGYLAIGAAPKFTMIDLLDRVKSLLFR